LFDLEMLERNPVAALAAMQRDWPAGVLENQFRYLPRTLAIGLALRLAGDGAAARSAFDSARVEMEVLVAGDPTEPRYRSALGTALAGLGRNDEAIREGEEGLRLMPPEREAWRGTWRMMELARICAMTGPRRRSTGWSTSCRFPPVGRPGGCTSIRPGIHCGSTHASGPWSEGSSSTDRVHHHEQQQDRQ
jgi:hypothetical protein